MDEPPARTPWRQQIAIYALAFGCFFQQSVLFPVLPRYADDLGISLSLIGVILAIRFLVPALVAARLGDLTSRFGLRRSITLAGLLMAAAAFLYPVADGVALLIVAQVVNGLLYIVAWVSAQAYATRTPDRDWVLGLFATCTGIGMTVGPIVGGLALDLAGYDAAWAAYGLGALALAANAWLLGDGAAGAPMPAGERRSPAPRGRAIALLRRPGLQAVFLFSFICLFTISIRGNFLPVYLEHVGVTASVTGLVLAAGSLGQAVVRPFTNVLLRRVHLRLTMMVAAVIGIVGLSAMPISSAAVLLMGLAFAHGLGAGLHQSLGLVLLARETRDDERAYAIGLRATVNQVSVAVAPLLAAVLADLASMEAAFLIIGGALLATTLWLRITLRHATRPSAAHAPIAD